MGICDWILVVFAVLSCLNLLLQFLFCYVMERIDMRRFSKAKAQNDNNAQPNVTERRKASRSIKQLIANSLQQYLYGLMRYSIILVGRFPSHHVRNWLYRYVFRMKITKRTVINGGCEIRSPWNIKADNCVIFSNCILDGRNGIEIGEDVVFGNGVHIWTEEHDVDSPTFACLEENRRPVKIGNRAWICSDSTILPGVTVGEGVVLASRACLTKDAEPFGIYAGIPARKIKQRNTELTYHLSGKPHWHFY